MQSNPICIPITVTRDLSSSGEESRKRRSSGSAGSSSRGAVQSGRATTDKPLLLDRLRQHEKLITDAYQQFSSAAQEDMPLAYAAEWLLDNFFVVQQTIRQVREDMPPGYYRELPKLANPDWVNIPRNYALASEIIDYSNYQLDIEQIVRFLQAFQADVPLTMGELWAFPDHAAPGYSEQSGQFALGLIMSTPPLLPLHLTSGRQCCAILHYEFTTARHSGLESLL